MDFSAIMGLLQKAVLAGGAIWLVIGAVILGLGLKIRKHHRFRAEFGKW